MLTLQRLLALRAVGEEGSFTRAAEKLLYSQSAVSQHIAALEDYLGIPLVNRQPRGVSLTQAGKILCGHADDIFKSVRGAERDLAALSGLEGGELHFASFPTAGSALLPPALARFREQHGNVKLIYDELETEDSLPKLLAGEIDLAIVFDYDVTKIADDPGFTLEPIMDEPLFIALPESHQLANREVICLDELRDDSWIGGSAFSCIDSLIKLCIREGFQPRIVFGSDDYTMVQGLIRQGIGIALIPALGTVAMIEGVVVIPLCQKTGVRRIYAARPTTEYQLPAAGALVDILIESAPVAVRSTAAGKLREPCDKPPKGSKKTKTTRKNGTAPKRRATLMNGSAKAKAHASR